MWNIPAIHATPKQVFGSAKKYGTQQVANVRAFSSLGCDCAAFPKVPPGVTEEVINVPNWYRCRDAHGVATSVLRHCSDRLGSSNQYSRRSGTISVSITLSCHS